MSDPAKQADPAPAPAPAPSDPAKQASILFPNDGNAADPAKPADPAAPADPAKPADPSAPAAADWKEYVPDPAKSDADNAAAKAEHDKTKPAAPDPADTVPEDGKYTIKMPDGVQADQELIDALSPDFKSMNLTQKQAQALADKFIATMQAKAQKQNETWANTVAGWADQAQADKEMGGAKWDQTKKDAVRAVERFGTPALKEYLAASGGGNHPEVIRAFAKVGAAIKEDSPPAGGAEGSGKPADAAHILFPNDKPKGS